jgi:hypothetical protein
VCALRKKKGSMYAYRSCNHSNSQREIKLNRERKLFPNGATAAKGPGPPHYRGFAVTLRHTTLDRTYLDEWPARRRHLYVTTHDTHEKQISMPPGEFRTRNPSKRAAADPRHRPTARFKTKEPVHFPHKLFTYSLESCGKQPFNYTTVADWSFK